MKNKKIIFGAIILIFVSLASPTHKASAYAAWPDIGNAFFRTMLDNIGIQIRAAIVGALKKAAIETLSETVNNLVSGTTQAASLFITDWEDYLFNGPTGTTNTYMNDFFTITTRGKSSGSYSSACGGSFAEWRSERAQNFVLEIDFTEWQSDFEEFACGPVEMFADGTWAAYDAFMEPKNNPLAYALMTESVYEKKLREEKEKAAIQANAYGGFIGQKSSDGKTVITPGSVIEGVTVAANTMDNDALANAENAGEIAGIVVGKIATGIIKQGIGNARKNVQNKINNQICDMSQSLRDKLKGLTPSGHLLNGGSGLGTLGDSRGSKCTVR